MVIEIKDKKVEEFLKSLSYKEIENLVNETLKEKIEDLQDYYLLRKTRKEKEVDFEKFIDENNN